MTIDITTPHKPLVVALYELDDDVKAHGAKLGLDLKTPSSLGFENWHTEAEGVVIRTMKITPDDVAKFGPSIKYIIKHGVGTDNIARAEARAKGVTIMNTAGVNARSVAELALGLALALARNFPAIDRRVRAGIPVITAEEGKVGMTLGGKALGIVGGGNIGFTLGKMWRGAFDGPIYLFDPYLTPANKERWAKMAGESDCFHVASTIDEMLPCIDVLSLHVPLLDSTKNLIDEAQFKKMKPSAILINTARGGVVNESALFKALNEGWIWAAGVDAFSKEPVWLNNFPELCSHERVISTPHIGAASLDVIKQTAMAALDHLAEVLVHGKPPRDVVHD